MLTKKNIDLLKKQHYGLVGKHSVVQICSWTKKSLVNEGSCYKQKFYGINSHRCCEMSPTAVWCHNKCVHCWRAIECTQGMKMPAGVEEPKEIIEGLIKARKKLLTGFKGNSKINMQKFDEAQRPNHFAISLIGEPTLYAKLPKMIKEIRSLKATSFIVSNGLNPQMLKKMEKQNALPTQLYISLNCSNKEDYDKWHRSLQKDAWKVFNKSLEVMKGLRKKTRTILRMTLVKGANSNMSDKDTDGYVEMIKKADPLFVEAKSYMSVGYARDRKDMGYDAMPNWKEIQEFAKKLVKALGSDYMLLGEHEYSRIVLIGKKKDKKNMKIQKV
jgi:tRNA wybutosine-synthesizing protein 1